jgi:archaellum component FlaF (FlaF/FlaG flagellin family)
MNRIFTLTFLVLIGLTADTNAQNSKLSSGSSTSRHFNQNGKINFNGQWRGGFYDRSSGFAGYGDDMIDYVLELECGGHLVTGYSYTYFYEGNKRYYTICKLTGTINKFTKEITVTEYERTKYNTPGNFNNCFQVHKLKYEKIGSDTERLVGRWYPAPNQAGNCGFGTSVLSRLIPKKNALKNNPKNNLVSNTKKTQPVKDTRQKNPVAIRKTNPNFNDLAKQDKKDTLVVIDTLLHLKDPDRQKNKEVAVYEKRKNTLEKSIDIENETVTIDLYDNGEVDGDSISVFFNGKLIVSHLMITEKAASFTLTIDKDRAYNELIMYAENLGTIPPNTALMVVKDGKNRYDVHITSDTERNGTIYFHYKGSGKTRD